MDGERCEIEQVVSMGQRCSMALMALDGCARGVGLLRRWILIEKVRQMKLGVQIDFTLVHQRLFAHDAGDGQRKMIVVRAEQFLFALQGMRLLVVVLVEMPGVVALVLQRLVAIGANVRRRGFAMR